MVFFEPAQHKGIEAYNHNLTLIARNKVIYLFKKRFINVCGIGFYLAVNGNTAAGGKRFGESRNPLLGIKQRNFFKLLKGKVADVSAVPAYSLQSLCASLK